MYKKLLTIILAIAVVATLGLVNISAASYSIDCLGDSSYPYWAHGGSCYDVSGGSKANAWGNDPNAWNSVELEHELGGEWFDHGINKGDMADVYSSTVSDNAAVACNDFFYYV